MKIILSVLLLISVGLNTILWSIIRNQRETVAAAEARAIETEKESVAREARPARQMDAASSSDTENRELLRLRNEVSQLRQKVAEASQWRRQASEAEQLRGRLMVATQELAHAEEAFRNVARLSPAELQEMKDEAYSVRCINNLKQLALAARIWANDHNDIFPPDFLTMKEAISSPKILFCPAETSVVPVSEWPAVNPSTITYRYLNAGGSDLEPQKVLLTCPIHGHEALSDGSVQRR